MSADSARSLPASASPASHDRPSAAQGGSAPRIPTPSAPGEAREQVVRRILQVAWMSIALGLSMQFLTLLVQTAFAATPNVATLVADTAQRVSWSSIVCLGLAIGNAASRLRGPAMGLLGLVSAPLGFAVAKSVQKSTAMALAVQGNAEAPSAILVWVLAGTKGLEYLVLGLLLWRISWHALGSLKAHVITGLSVGLVFATIVLAESISLSQAAPPPAKMAVLLMNELVFPMGCSLVIYFSAYLAGALPSASETA